MRTVRDTISFFEVVVEKFIQFAITLTFTFFFATQHLMAAPFPASPVLAADDPLIVRTQGFQFQLGISDGMVFGVLSRNGYSDIRIVKRKLTKTRAEACKGGIKFKLEVHTDGRIRNARRTGRCRSVINVENARKILTQRGFRKIQLVPDSTGFIASACRGDRRFRVSVSRFGDIGREKVLGRCGRDLTRRDVATLLREYGYSRVRVDRARRGNFSSKACRGDDRVALLVGRGGAILTERRIGRCDPPIHPATIPAVLARKGFTRIDVIDRRLPRYVAHACRNRQRLEISMNRFGRIVEERSIGRCEPPLSAAALEARLRDIGYDQVRIVKDGASGFVAEVCEEGARFRLDLTRYGETISETRLGECPSRRVGKILKQLEKEGIRGATLYVNGCRKRKLFRIELDHYGSVVKRTVTGRCR